MYSTELCNFPDPGSGRVPGKMILSRQTPGPLRLAIFELSREEKDERQYP
jgi:hypothetical protein